MKLDHQILTIDIWKPANRYLVEEVIQSNQFKDEIFLRGLLNILGERI